MTARWSKTPPTVPGFWWMRTPDMEGRAGVVEVVRTIYADHGPRLLVWGTHGGGWDFSALPDAEWCGPIELPREGDGCRLEAACNAMGIALALAGLAAGCAVLMQQRDAAEAQAFFGHDLMRGRLADMAGIPMRGGGGS